MTNDLEDYVFFELRSIYKEPYELVTNENTEKEVSKNLHDK